MQATVDPPRVMNELAPETAPFPVWRMEDGRVFTDFLHRSAYDEPGPGSFWKKEMLRDAGAESRRRAQELAEASAQKARCQAAGGSGAVPVPGFADAQACDARSCRFSRGEADGLGLGGAGR